MSEEYINKVMEIWDFLEIFDFDDTIYNETLNGDYEHNK